MSFYSYLYPLPPSRPQNQAFPPSSASNLPPFPQKKLPKSCQQATVFLPLLSPIQKNAAMHYAWPHIPYTFIFFSASSGGFPSPLLSPAIIC